jgi:hypothetical protein
MLDVVTQFHQSDSIEDRLKSDNSTNSATKTSGYKNSKHDINSPDFTPGLQSNEQAFNRDNIYFKGRFIDSNFKAEPKKYTIYPYFRYISLLFFIKLCQEEETSQDESRFEYYLRNVFNFVWHFSVTRHSIRSIRL